jgi:hypothetical protein
VRHALESLARPPQPSLSPSAFGGGGAPTTRLTATDASGTGNRWVPPVLHGNRPAQYRLGAGVLALAVALVLILANPFKGDEMPADWVVRPEGEVVAADVAVPKDYTRVAGSDGTSVTFNDPSGVFSVYLERRQPEEGEKPWDEVGTEAKERVDSYKEGGENGTEIQEVKSKTVKAQQQGEEARDIVTSFRDYAASDDDIRYRWHERLVVSKDNTTYWRLRVTMPAQGDAAGNGEKLFADVAKYLLIKDL